MTRSSAAAPARADIYSRVTSHIIADLENGVRPWLKPWSTGNTAGPITKPLRGNGQPYKGVNVLMLWTEAAAQGYASPTWLTYRQAAEHGGQVRKGEHGSLVVYADRIRKTDTADNGEEIERESRFCGVTRCSTPSRSTGCPSGSTRHPPLPGPPLSASPAPSISSGIPPSTSAMAATAPFTRSMPIGCNYRHSRASRTPKRITRPCCMRWCTRLRVSLSPGA